MAVELPLQGTKLLVRIAISRSLGESMILGADVAAGVAAKPIHMVKDCFAVRARFKILIHIKGDPGQVAGILQQGEQGERSPWEAAHDGDDPREGFILPSTNRPLTRARRRWRPATW